MFLKLHCNGETAFKKGERGVARDGGEERGREEESA